MLVSGTGVSCTFALGSSFEQLRHFARKLTCRCKQRCSAGGARASKPTPKRYTTASGKATYLQHRCCRADACGRPRASALQQVGMWPCVTARWAVLTTHPQDKPHTDQDIWGGGEESDAHIGLSSRSSMIVNVISRIQLSKCRLTFHT